MFKAGDILYSYLDGKYHVYKILRRDEWGTYHTLIYQPMDREPVEADVDSLQVMAWHAPIGSFPTGELLTVRPVVKEELVGYLEYLKMVDFGKYLEESGQDPAEAFAKAKALYKEAYYLTDAKKTEEAIVKYQEALEVFRPFFEAWDNMAFVKMDLGRWKEAIADFEESLKYNPEGYAATFSIGECYYKMNDRENARIWFKKATELDPNQRIGWDFLARVT